MKTLYTEVLNDTGFSTIEEAKTYLSSFGVSEAQVLKFGEPENQEENSCGLKTWLMLVFL